MKGGHRSIQLAVPNIILEGRVSNKLEIASVISLTHNYPCEARLHRASRKGSLPLK